MKLSPLEEALACLDRGWSVVPLRQGSKKPLIDWRSRRHRLPLPAELQGWLGRWPEAGLGIVTGGVSGLLVLDVDPLKGSDRALGMLEAQFGRLPPTLAVRTGGGGRHLYFRTQGAPVATTIVRGLEVHGEDSYVVAPPSLHLTGRAYAWEGQRPSHGSRPAAAPRWLLELATPVARPRPVPLLLARGPVGQGAGRTVVRPWAAV